MTLRLPPQCLLLLSFQSGVIASWQAEAAGLGPRQIENLVRYGRWQRLHLGVYAAFTGKPPREAVLWAAVLRAGPQAALSHETAAGLYGILGDRSRLIHVTVPHPQHVQPVTGLVIHRSSRLLQTRDAGFCPPRTMIEDTVFDLAQSATSFDDVIALLARSCQQALTTPFLLARALEERPRMRWRAEIRFALEDVADGVHSPLEFRYLRDVERAHGLPAGDRQVAGLERGRTVFRDVRYRKYAVVVELDGRASHPAEQRWADRRRDNAAAAHGEFTLRYGWADVTEQACETAFEVGGLLGRRGWKGALRRCGPDCRLPLS
jgi:hypothetical protein